MDPMNYTPPVQPAPAPSPAYTTSCLKAAWEDVKATPNYISRLLVLGLIMCVPILNFVVAGYLLFWSREVPFGGRSLLPQKIVTGKNFEYGFYAFVLTLVVGLVGGIIGGIFGWIPFIGWGGLHGAFPGPPSSAGSSPSPFPWPPMWPASSCRCA